ncbi:MULTISPECIES: hypothetical protein [Stenotrophomonas]|uniref:hypothetical protein n=1 Tax=Stenotrophomonas TaxID=40323 RepID=UPI001E3B3FD0|nr:MULTISPECIES: hypothetical protein [Stenotrophomonas maltophilia group]
MVDGRVIFGAFARVNSPLIDPINNVVAMRNSNDRLPNMRGMAAQEHLDEGRERYHAVVRPRPPTVLTSRPAAR